MGHLTALGALAFLLIALLDPAILDEPAETPAPRSELIQS